MSFPSKEKKGKLVRPLPSNDRDLSWESFSQKERRMKNLSLKKLSLSSDSAPGGTGPGNGYYNYNITITEVDPENIPFCYSATTAKMASEDIPSYYSKQVEVEPRTFHVEFCSKCGTEHHPRSYCPALPCKTCFDPHHTSADCPYFSHIPKGAIFDRVNYEIICGCGNIFNEDKWVCTFCNGRPKLHPKYCHICRSSYAQHSSHECPKDKERAARFKAIRDQALSRKKIPYTG